MMMWHGVEAYSWVRLHVLTADDFQEVAQGYPEVTIHDATIASVTESSSPQHPSTSETTRGAARRGATARDRSPFSLYRLRGFRIER